MDKNIDWMVCYVTVIVSHQSDYYFDHDMTFDRNGREVKQQCSISEEKIEEFSQSTTQ